ncbi:MAG TPA: alkaline phosphatase family protein [Phycisphaerae bacterium]|nr:alkaline phosphatase family protein [Phycisphaerae bacterium]
MPKVCFILVAGLSRSLVSRLPSPDSRFGGSIADRSPIPFDGFAHSAPLRPVIPAVTCTMQATLATGVLPERHGIISNGLFTFNHPELHPLLDTDSFPEFRKQISFWEQSNGLLQAPRFWSGSGLRTAMLFWQQSIPDAADIILTPKPEHTPDGKTISACWSRPADLYARLVKDIGPFPLHNYWGPMASLPSSEWILRSALEVWLNFKPDIQFVYVPHLDYNLQRLGPDHPQILTDVAQVDRLLTPIVQSVRADGGVCIIAGDYAMSAVSSNLAPNQSLRRADLLRTRPDANGKLLIDFETSEAIAMVDHQIAHVYCRPRSVDAAFEVLRGLDGIDRIARTSGEKGALGLNSPRSGDLILLSAGNAFFIHDWWFSDDEKPVWQFSVDIHRKPGYDPRELFFDPVHKCISQNAALVKGSHGLMNANRTYWPILFSDVPIPLVEGVITAENCAAWLRTLLMA